VESQYLHSCPIHVVPGLVSTFIEMGKRIAQQKQKCRHCSGALQSNYLLSISIFQQTVRLLPYIWGTDSALKAIYNSLLEQSSSAILLSNQSQEDPTPPQSTQTRHEPWPTRRRWEQTWLRAILAFHHVRGCGADCSNGEKHPRIPCDAQH